MNSEPSIPAVMDVLVDISFRLSPNEQVVNQLTVDKAIKRQ